MRRFHRRDACPSLDAPMRTGDGLLVRFSPRGGALAPDVVEGLAHAALAFGNGALEVTARGALQFRGLRSDTAGPFAHALRQLGITAEPRPMIVVGPLAGLDGAAVADPRPIARDISLACSALHLGPKVTVVVDGGGRLHLDAVPADIRLLAAPAPEGVLWHLSAAGQADTARRLGALATADAAEGVRRVLLLLALRGPRTRARDLSDASVREALGGLTTRSRSAEPRAPADAVGLHVLEGMSVLGVAGSFGQIRAEALASFAHEAARHGSREIRPAPGRVLLATSLSPAGAGLLRDAAAGQGFLTDPADPRRRVVACPGSPACGSGEVASRALASELAASASELLDGSATLHVSGCAKGCAHPGSAAITLVGSDGRVDVLLGATARDAPLCRLWPEEVPGALRRLGRALDPLCRDGRSMAAALPLIGLERVLSLLLEDTGR